MSAREWVRLREEAFERGFVRFDAQGRRVGNALQFRRWCHAHGVPIVQRAGERMEWVQPAAIDAAIAGAAREAQPANDRGAQLAAAMMGSR